MKKEEALKIIKSLIDESIRKGIMANIETVISVGKAFDLITIELTKENDA